MLPTLLIAGFVVGLLTQRPLRLVTAVLVLGLLWAVLIALDGDNGFTLVLGAFGLGGANAAVGVLVGALPWLVAERLRPVH